MKLKFEEIEWNPAKSSLESNLNEKKVKRHKDITESSLKLPSIAINYHFKPIPPNRTSTLMFFQSDRV